MDIMTLFVAFRECNGFKEMLFLRGRDTYYLMPPTTTQAPGEPIEATLQRGLSDQLMTPVSNINPLGVINGYAPDGRIAIMHLFSGDLDDTTTLAVQNGQAEWMNKDRLYLHAGSLPTMMLDKTLPYLERQGIW